jgi:hypothetical protein
MTAELTLTTLAGKINAAHAACEGAFTESLQHARRAGELLTQAKGQVEHGAWLPWLEAHCDFAPRTAQLYMRIYRQWDELANAQRVAYLSVRDAGEVLSAPTSSREPAAPGSADILAVYGMLRHQLHVFAETQARTLEELQAIDDLELWREWGFRDYGACVAWLICFDPWRGWVGMSPDSDLARVLTWGPKEIIAELRRRLRRKADKSVLEALELAFEEVV